MTEITVHEVTIEEMYISAPWDYIKAPVNNRFRLPDLLVFEWFIIVPYNENSSLANERFVPESTNNGEETVHPSGGFMFSSFYIFFPLIRENWRVVDV